jgi:anti-sigma factor ChrR (cupin superfamily)
MSCAQGERLHAYALHALPSDETSAIETHLSTCLDCREELESLQSVVDRFVSWPVDVLRPSTSLWERLSQRIASETGGEPSFEPSRQSPPLRWAEPEWEEVAPGIFCKLLATDSERGVVSKLVRLAPGVHYPPHTHAGTEELHLLDGELWIDDRKLHPGDYNRAEAGTSDAGVWSKTSCTCVLIASSRDRLG